MHVYFQENGIGLPERTSDVRAVIELGDGRTVVITLNAEGLVIDLTEDDRVESLKNQTYGELFDELGLEE